jgi:hypothetical protein
LVTLPERIQLAQARIVDTRPPTKALTRWTLGSQRRFVLLFAWETLFPVPGFFPQISHWRAITLLPNS